MSDRFIGNIPELRGNIKALPKWAQEHIESLTRLALDQQKDLERGPENSDTFNEPYENNTPLGDAPTVRFILGDALYGRKAYVDCRISSREYGNGGRKVLTVMTSGGLILKARSSNLVIVETERD